MAHKHLNALEDYMENMDESETPLHASTNEYSTTGCQRLSMLIRDEPNWLNYVRRLKESDLIILLTPIVHSANDVSVVASDPFQSLESSLSNRHSRIHHTPYIQRDGIISTHVGLIKRGHIIILCFVLEKRKSLPIHIAKNLFAVSDNKPTIILVCCKPLDPEGHLPFPCVIQTFGYSPPALEATAALIFGEDPSGSSINLYLNVPVDTRVPRVWPIESWSEARDTPSIEILWRECFGTQFWILPQNLNALLQCSSYAKHYVVRHSISGEVLGFCATYLSPADPKGEKLIGSLAFILVRPLFREEGIGLSLHSHAIEELKKTQGVTRIQLGSTFPRIFHGLLQETSVFNEWFRRRGWPLHSNLPGQGRPVYDFILKFCDWRFTESAKTPFYCRTSTPEDLIKILEFLKEICLNKNVKMGWYEQFLQILNGPNIDDIVIAIEDQVIVAAALIYSPQCSSILRYNLSWAGFVGRDVGGLTCMCLPTDRKVDIRDELRNGLIEASIMKLRGQGMKMLLLDGVVDGIDNLRLQGFHEWARYCEVWMDLININ